MPKKRTKLSMRLTKLVFQEGGSKCAFCPEFHVAALEIHHIDGNPSNNAFANLILLCATCHSKAEDGVLSAEAVRLRKERFLKPDGTPKPITSVEGIRIGQPQFVPRRLSPRDMRMRRRV